MYSRILISHFPGAVLFIILGSLNVQNSMTKFDMFQEPMMLGIGLEVIEHFIVVHKVCKILLRRKIGIGRHFFGGVDDRGFHDG